MDRNVLSIYFSYRYHRMVKQTFIEVYNLYIDTYTLGHNYSCLNNRLGINKLRRYL